MINCTVSGGKHFYEGPSERETCAYCWLQRSTIESQEQAESTKLVESSSKLGQAGADHIQDAPKMVLEPSIADWKDNTSPTPKLTPTDTKEGWEIEFDDFYHNDKKIQLNLLADEIKDYIRKKLALQKQEFEERKKKIEKLRRPYDKTKVPMCRLGHISLCDCESVNETIDKVLSLLEEKK